MTLSVKELIVEADSPRSRSITWQASDGEEAGRLINTNSTSGLREKNLIVSVMHPIQIIAGQMGFTGRI